MADGDTSVIRKALEAKIEAFSPGFPTQPENVGAQVFTPPSKAPYQRLTLLLPKPNVIFVSSGHYRQRGYMQIDLLYPQGTGAGAADDRADGLRDWFWKPPFTWDGLTAYGVEIKVEEPPEIATGQNQGDRYFKPVRVYFYADVWN